MRVLLCDDDPRLRAVIGALLADHGHVVAATAEEADEGLDLLGRARPDIVIVDLALRRGSGLDVARAAVAAGLKAVIFSSFVTDLPVVPAGAVAVAKPDFCGLEAVLHGITARDAAGDDAGGARERRRLRVVGRSLPVSPIEEPDDFYKALGSAWDGDAVLVLRAEDERAAREVAAVTRSIVRNYDNVTCRGTEVLVLLAACGEHAGVVEARIRHAWRTRPGALAAPQAGHTTIAAGEAPSDALARARAEARAAAASTAARAASTAARFGVSGAAVEPTRRTA